ncbi:MAG: asparaginase domain-containing protein [Calditrichia bacterium]
MKIGILYTGGTIGCISEPLVPLDEARFEAAFMKHLAPVVVSRYPACEMRFIPFGLSIDSTNVQPRDWCTMASAILESYMDFDAFVVLHGTDTMAWTASAMSFLLTGLNSDGYPNAVLSRPVVFTGAQLPLFQELDDADLQLLFNTDAFQNVCGAFAAAHAGVQEVCLYFNDVLYRGNRTVKTSASDFNAFLSPNFPPLGTNGTDFFLQNDHIQHLPTTATISLDDAEARKLLRKQLNYITAHIDETTVMPFLAFPASFGNTNGRNHSFLNSLLSTSLEQGVEGVILQAYGEGNFPSGNPENPHEGALFQTLKKAHDDGTILIDCSQVLNGVVDSQSYAAGSWLGSSGAIGAFDMTSVAALTKLYFLLTLRDYDDYHWDQRTLERLMLTNLMGEIMDVHRLDTRGKEFLAPGESIVALDGSIILFNHRRLGPVLQTRDKKEILWQAIENPEVGSMPGRLYMQADGNLIFYDGSNTVLYASETARPTSATSMLVLDGASSSAGIRLYIYNYAKSEISKVLFSG